MGVTMAQSMAVDAPYPGASPAWRIRFDDASAFRTIVATASVAASRIVFKFTRVGADYMLSADCNDLAESCYVSSRLLVPGACMEGGEAGEFSFCVECKHVLLALDDKRNNHLGITLETYPSISAKLHILVKADSYLERYLLETFVDQLEPPALQDLNFTTALEVDLERLKEFIRKARHVQAEKLRIAIRWDDAGGTRTRTQTLFECDGAMCLQMCIDNDMITNDDGSCVVVAVPDVDNPAPPSETATPKYDHKFPVDKIEAFLKHVPGRKLLCKIEENMPLIMTIPLGPTDDTVSNVRYLVGCSNNDD